MGNAPSTAKKKPRKTAKTPEQQWNWTIRDGHVVDVTRRRQKLPPPSRPLFKKQPSDDYSWWYANPARNNKRND